MTRRDLAAAVMVGIVAVGMVYALTRIQWGAFGVTAPGFAWAGWLLVFPAFRAGQYARGYAHARGIRRSHWTAIRGGHR